MFFMGAVRHVHTAVKRGWEFYGLVGETVTLTEKKVCNVHIALMGTPILCFLSFRQFCECLRQSRHFSAIRHAPCRSIQTRRIITDHVDRTHDRLSR